MLRFIVGALLCIVSVPSLTSAQTKPSRPNILFVLIDDMGYHDFACFGGTRAKTPNVDRLAAEGIKFTQFYVAAPICSPSRVGFTTGQYPNRWRITSYLDTREIDRKRGVVDWLDPSAPSLARILHDQAGYYTAHVGKWHMGGQRDIGDAPLITAYGFDRSLTSFEGLGERLLPKFRDVGGKPLRHEPTLLNAKLGGPITWVERDKVSERFVDRAIEEMKTAQKKHQPFYINLWPDDVHSPCQAPTDELTDADRDDPPANYVGVLNELDRQLGRAFDFVRSQPDLRDNTLILVASDNGPELPLGNSAPLRGSKGQLYEGGIRLPLITWFPGGMRKTAVGSTNDKNVISAIDFAPSLMALVGISGPPKDVIMDGSNVMPELLGTPAVPRNTPLMWVRPPDRPGRKGAWPDLAIRDGNWKLLVHRDGSRAELFDLSIDPNETTNLAKDQPDRAKQMAERVIAWDKQTSR